LPKMVYLNNEELSVPVEVAHFGEKVLNNITPTWNIKNVSGKVLFSGQLPSANIPLGNCHQLGEIKQSLASIDQPSKLSLTIAVGDHQNSWDLFVYPATLPDVDKNIFVTQQLDEQAIQTLKKGGKVLLTLKKGSLKPEKGGDVLIGFSSIFWNTAWTGGQAPNTLGILCNPKHPALSAFPTEYYSNWQWWDAMSHSNAIKMDSVAIGMQPIIRVIDDWVTANSLGLVFECRVGTGKLIVSGIDLVSNQDKRPEASQLLYSIKRYMATPEFAPKIQVDVERIKGLSKEQFFSAAK